MMKICPVCGKFHAVHWPEHWVYRRGEYYMCSANCLDVFVTREYRERIGWIRDYNRRKKMQKKITLEQKKKAVEIALGGGDPMEYLRECGSKNPSAHWSYIRKTLKEKDPETYEKLAKKEEPKVNLTIKSEDLREIDDAEILDEEQAMMVKAAEENVREMQEHLNRTKPLVYDGFTVTSIRGIFGEYHMDMQHNSLDWHSTNGDEICMRPDAWQSFLTEIRRVMAILGA